MTGHDRRPADFYAIDDLPTEQEQRMRTVVRELCDREVLPVINDSWERAQFRFDLVPKIRRDGSRRRDDRRARLPGMSAVSAGLMAMEWARADGSIGTFYGVHSFLAMQAIDLLAGAARPVAAGDGAARLHRGLRPHRARARLRRRAARDRRTPGR